MDVARGEKLLLTRSNPAVAGRGLTLRAVAVAARVVRDGAMPATSARIEMTTECGGTTARNGQQHFDVLPADPLAISFDKGGSRRADQIGQGAGRSHAVTHVTALCCRKEDIMSVENNDDITGDEQGGVPRHACAG